LNFTPQTSDLTKNNTSAHLKIGEIGEAYALEFLIKNKFKFITKNWTCKLGEIDIIVKDQESLVFVEVKTRRESSLARKNILANITWHKQKKLKQTTQVYLFKNYSNSPRPKFRIDVVGIILDRGTLRPLEIRHIKGAVGD